jgi:hypothetical protein
MQWMPSKLENQAGRHYPVRIPGSALDAPYRISRSLIVKDSRLTIQPGVIIEFENGTGIKVGDSDESTLIAVGTPTNPITFTGVTKVAGAWENIDFHFTKSPLNEISHAIIEYGGNPGSGGVVYMWAKSVVKVPMLLSVKLEAARFMQLLAHQIPMKT